MRRGRLVGVLAVFAAVVAVGAVPPLRRLARDAIAPSPVCEEVDRLARVERQIAEATPRTREHPATPLPPADPAREVVASLHPQPDGTVVVRVGSDSIPLPPRAAGPEGDDARQRARTSITAAIARAAQARTKPTGRVVEDARIARDDVVLVADAFLAAGVVEVAFGGPAPQ